MRLIITIRAGMKLNRLVYSKNPMFTKCSNIVAMSVLYTAWYSINVERLRKGLRQNKRREVVSLIVVNYALIDSNQPITKIWKRKWKPPSFSIVYLYQLVAVCLYYVAVAEQVDALVLPKDTSKGRSLAQIRVGIMQGANPCQRL